MNREDSFSIINFVAIQRQLRLITKLFSSLTDLKFKFYDYNKFDCSLCKLGPEHLLLFKSDSKQIETRFRIQNTVSNDLCDQFS